MLKVLMLNKKLTQSRSVLEAHLEKDDFEKREKDLEAAIDEAETDEEMETIEAEITKLTNEKSEFEDEKTKLEEQVEDLERQLEELNSKEPKPESNDNENRSKGNDEANKNRGGNQDMKRHKFFGGLTRSEALEVIKREDVQTFLESTRNMINEKRAVQGSELTIPTVFLDLLRDNLNQYSKLISKVFLKPVAGKARQNIAGAVPEAVWTEMVAKLNELDIVFNQFEVDGYKVGGYIAVPNSILEDSELALANEIMTSIGQAIGLALDKAILYGQGRKMPVGIVTRLAETTQPNYWGNNEPEWTNLSETHLQVIDPAADDEKKFYQDLIRKLGVAKANYSNGGQFWAMASTTYKELQAKALMFNANGTILSGQTKTMPIVGGDVVELDFIPNDVIVGGYGSLYMLAERAGGEFASSEHAQFIEDNTVFKGTARYDGRPVFGEGFVAINISQSDLAEAPSADAVTFAHDAANE